MNFEFDKLFTFKQQLKKLKTKKRRNRITKQQ